MSFNSFLNHENSEHRLFVIAAPKDNRSTLTLLDFDTTKFENWVNTHRSDISRIFKKCLIENPDSHISDYLEASPIERMNMLAHYPIKEVLVQKLGLKRVFNFPWVEVLEAASDYSLPYTFDLPQMLSVKQSNLEVYMDKYLLTNEKGLDDFEILSMTGTIDGKKYSIVYQLVTLHETLSTKIFVNQRSLLSLYEVNGTTEKEVCSCIFEFNPFRKKKFYYFKDQDYLTAATLPPDTNQILEILTNESLSIIQSYFPFEKVDALELSGRR